MAGYIENIDRILKGLTDEWSWEFAYAPKPGQQRIKITAVNRDNPRRRKVLVLTEELLKRMPASKLSPHILRLLPMIPESHTGEAPVPRREIFQQPRRAQVRCSVETEYELLRRRYQSCVDELRAGSHLRSLRLPVPRPSDAPENDWTAYFSRGFHRVLLHFSRKTTPAS